MPRFQRYLVEWISELEISGSRVAVEFETWIVWTTLLLKACGSQVTCCWSDDPLMTDDEQ